MERWRGRLCVVSGASAGIGAAVSKTLLNSGMTVVGLGRRLERFEEVRKDIPPEVQNNFYTLKCDVSSEVEVANTFKWIDNVLGGVDVMVNNAGVVKNVQLVDKGNTKQIKEVLDTNIMGVVLCTQQAFQSMKRRKVDGHIIIINSLVGHRIPMMMGLGAFNIYPATKYAVTALTESLRQEFLMENTRIKITSISPGAVRTEIFGSNTMPLEVEIPFLDPEDVAESVLYALGTPPHVQVHELTLQHVGELF